MHTLAVELLDFEERGHAFALGFSSVASYAREVHELSPRTVRDLTHLARCLRTLPMLDQALRTGEIPWTKGRTLTPILTPDNEQAWIDSARTHPVRTLEAMVADSLPGELPPPPEDCKSPPRRRVTLTMPAVDAEFLHELAQRERAKAPEVELSDGELIVSVLRRAVHDAAPACKDRYQIVLEHCPSCRATSGRRAHVEEAIAEEAPCNAEVIDMVSQGAARGRRTRTVPPKTRAAVRHAYREQCAVPGCQHRLWLDVHHVHGFASGGGHEESNLVLLCTAHHRMLHQGVLSLVRDQDCWVFTTQWGPERRAPIPLVPTSPSRSSPPTASTLPSTSRDATAETIRHNEPTPPVSTSPAPRDATADGPRPPHTGHQQRSTPHVGASGQPPPGDREPTSETSTPHVGSGAPSAAGDPRGERRTLRRR